MEKKFIFKVTRGLTSKKITVFATNTFEAISLIQNICNENGYIKYTLVG